MDQHHIFSLTNNSLNADISCKKHLTAKQAEYVYSKFEDEEVIGPEQVKNDECKLIITGDDNSDCLVILSCKMAIV